MKKYTRGFTLIELLVVISIISMLSSVVLVSLSSAREKAKVGSGLIFASNAFHLLGVSSFGYYDFNAGAGVALDFSQYRRDGVLTGGATYASGVTPTGSGYSVRLQGNQYVALSGGTNYTPPTSFTNMAWVYPEGGNGQYAVVAGASGSAFQVPYGDRVRYYDGTTGTSYDSPIGSVSLNKWNHVAVVVEAATLKFYVNGKLVQTTPYSGTITEQMITMLGFYPVGGGADHYFKGYIDDVGIFQTPLTLSQIQKAYVAGLPTHTVAEAY